MITFRKILAASSGKLVAAYFTQHEPEVDRKLRCEPAHQHDRDGRLTSYYTGREQRAHWRLDMPLAVAKVLGIDPTRTPKAGELNHLFEAKRGDSGEAWSAHKRTNSSFDFTFSPHKSISLAIEFAKTPAEAAMLWTAVLRANDAAMKMIAGDLGWARIGHGGEDGAEPGAVGWCSFPHTQARPTLSVKDGKDGITYLAESPVVGDPQTHVHNAFWNLVVTDDGRIGSMDTQRLTGPRVMVWGALGQAVLAENMRRLGVRVAVDSTGRFAVLPAIPEHANDHFSKGSKQALRNAKRFAKRQGLEWDTLTAEQKIGLTQSAALHERQSKAARSGAKKEGQTPREMWEGQAATIGWRHDTVLEGTVRAQLSDAERYDAAYSFAAKHLAKEFETAAVLDRDVVLTWAIRGLIGAGYRGPEDIERVAGLIEERGFELHGQRAYLVSGMKDNRLQVTNSEQIRIERRGQELARAAVHDRTGALQAAAIRRAIEVSGIDFSSDHGKAQVAAIYALGTAGGLAYLTGVAGAGKSTLLRPLVAAYHADTQFDPRGREVIGTANAWQQADALKGAGVEKTMALDPLLKAIDRGEIRPTQNTVLIIEEMSQIGPRSLLRLLEVQAETGMTIRGLGDEQQNQSIEAGDAMALLNRVVPREAHPELRSTIRQKTPELKALAAMFRNDDEQSQEQRIKVVAAALQTKRVDGTARMLGGDVDEVNGQIADFFLRRRDALAAAGTNANKGITCSALTNDDAAAISGQVRARLRERGEIVGEDRLFRAIDQRGERYDLPIAIGDRVRLFQRTSARIDGRSTWVGNNGDMLTVEAVADEGLHIRNREGTRGLVEWRRLADPRTGRLYLCSGWAMTIDSMQGVTATEHINALPRGSAGTTAFKNYPAESRAEYDTWTMVGEAAIFEAVRHGRALGDQSPITTDDLWGQVAKDMAHAPRKAIGLSLLKQMREEAEAENDRWLRAERQIQVQQAGGRNHAAELQQRLADADLCRSLAKHLEAKTALTPMATPSAAPKGCAEASSLRQLRRPDAAPRPSKSFNLGPS